MTYSTNYAHIDFSKPIVFEKERINIQAKRSDLPAPMLISDQMPQCEHVDGKFYTSKAAFRAVTKANGLVEVGNDSARLRTPKVPDRDKAIDQAVDRAIARVS